MLKTNWVVTGDYTVFHGISKHLMLKTNGFQHSIRNCFFYFKTSYVKNKQTQTLYQIRAMNFKTSYVKNKHTVLSHSSAHQFSQNRSTAGFSSKFTSQHQILVMIPINVSFLYKIKLFHKFIKSTAGKILQKC